MIICETDITPDYEDDYYFQLYYYFPTMMCMDLMKNNNFRLRGVIPFIGYLAEITKLL